MISIRAATPADAEAIARVHIASWRSTYKGLVPSEFLAALSYERRTEQWGSALENPDRNYIFVAEHKEIGIVGFVDCGPEREGRREYPGEIYAIYLYEQYQGRGIGKQLFDKAVDELKQRGHHSILLWVLIDNPSRGFYVRMGGEEISQKEIEIGGVNLVEVAYGWKQL
ncbi:MAG: GNAT family N-acetyltransferase [Anaerolineales bacterium]